MGRESGAGWHRGATFFRYRTHQAGRAVNTSQFPEAFGLPEPTIELFDKGPATPLTKEVSPGVTNVDY